VNKPYIVKYTDVMHGVSYTERYGNKQYADLVISQLADSPTTMIDSYTKHGDDLPFSNACEDTKGYIVAVVIGDRVQYIVHQDDQFTLFTRDIKHATLFPYLRSKDIIAFLGIPSGQVSILAAQFVLP